MQPSARGSAAGRYPEESADLLRRTVRLSDGAPAASGTVDTVRRGTSIVGLMLEDLSDQYLRRRRRAASTAAWAAHMSWGLLELAAPRSLVVVLIEYWVWLILALALAMIVLGNVLGNSDGVAAMGGVLAFVAGVCGLLASTLRRFFRFGRVLWWLALAGFVYAGLALDWLRPWLTGRVADHTPGQLSWFAVWISCAAMLCAWFSRRSVARPHVVLLLVASLGLAAVGVELRQHCNAWLTQVLPATGALPFTMPGLFLAATSIALAIAIVVVTAFSRHRALPRWVKKTSAPQRHPTVRQKLPDRESLRKDLDNALWRARRWLRSLIQPKPRTRILPRAETDILNRTLRLADGEPDRVAMMRSASCAHEITGRMLEQLMGDTTQLSKWLRRSGTVHRLLVECAAPRTVHNAFYRHWIWLLLCASAAIMLIGVFLARPGVTKAGVVLGLAAVTALAIIRTFTSFFHHQSSFYGLGLPVTAVAGTASIFVLEGMAAAKKTMAAAGHAAFTHQLQHAPGPLPLPPHGVIDAAKQFYALDSVFVPLYVLLLAGLATFLPSLSSLWRRPKLSVLPAVLLAASAGVVDWAENLRAYVLLHGLGVPYGPVTQWKDLLLLGVLGVVTFAFIQWLIEDPLPRLRDRLLRTF